MLCEDVLYKCNAKYPIIHSSHQRGNNEKPFCRNGYFGPFVFGETTLQPNAYDRKFILFYGFTKLLFTFTIIMQRSWTCGGQKTSISLSAMHTFSFSTIVNFTGDWKCPKHFFVGKKNILRNVHFWCNICTKDFLIKMDYFKGAL